MSRAPRASSDQLSTENATLLRAALVRQPEVRSDVVARARAILSDPAYPPMAVMRLIAQQILAAPDVSEDQS
ncbi:MAG: hypothetical protein ABIZ81_16075 [Opitutaceae bacterium]